MPRHKSAIKQLRASHRKSHRNIQVQSRLKTLVRNVEKSLTGTDAEQSNTALKTAISSFQRAASRKVIHKNTASRKISRLMKKANKAKISK
jgi:small subunit ribosomal protein S20